MRVTVVALVVMTAWLSFASIEADATATCTKLQAPIYAPPPKFPLILHNEYEGTIEVSLIIKRDGHVEDVTIRSMKLSPAGHGGNNPIGYKEAIVSSVQQWRYPRQPYACHRTIPINLVFDDTSAS